MGLLVRKIVLEERVDKIHNGAILFSPSSSLILSLRSKYHPIICTFSSNSIQKTDDNDDDDDDVNNNNT